MRRPVRAAALVAAATVLSLPATAGVVWGATPSADGPPHASHLDPGLSSVGMQPSPVIVQAAPGQSAAAAVDRAGGRVLSALPVVNGVLASVPARDLPALAAYPAVVAVTSDRTGHFQSQSMGASAPRASTFPVDTQATAQWKKGDQGAGVGVAVIDTGVSPMNDLKSHVVYGPDLSGENTLTDSYGHGTVIAGAIAGDGTDSGDSYTGTAPAATIISVKVAGRGGAVDVSTILEAMSWVSAYRNQYNIRVLNLSYGVPSTQDPGVDPLDYAVERLWQQGIVVVVAAGNSGPAAGTINKPGDDPLALTVGAYDEHGDDRPGNDTVPDWSSQGPTAQGVGKPDLVAPGRTLVLTRSYGSTVEAGNPDALIAPSYITGSGTSEAAAVTSGIAALVVGAHPNWTPDQVKHALVSSAAPIPGVPATAQGAGRIAAADAVAAKPGPAVQQRGSATGLGSLEASRGGVHVTATIDGASWVVSGEVTDHLQPWTGNAWTGNTWTGNAWTGTAWTGTAWTGTAWTGNAWTGNAWTGNAWTGNAWTGNAWTGNAWTGAAWGGAGDGAGNADGYQNAFWGAQPPYTVHLPGEVSGPTPPGLRNPHGPGTH